MGRTKYLDIKNYIDNTNNCKLITSEDEFILQKIEQNKNGYEVKLIIKCRCGENFTTSFDKFKNRNKRQCLKCGRKITGKKLKYTYELVKKIVSEKSYELLDDKYYDNKTKMTLKDSLEYFYFTNLSNLLQDKLPNRFDPSNPYSLQNIKLWLIYNNKPYTLISEIYKGFNVPHLYHCNICGENFKISLGNLFIGRKCSYCSGRKAGLSNCLATNNLELSSEWHPTKNGNLTPYDVTCGSNKIVWWKCSNGHEWETQICYRSNNIGCPYCCHNLPSSDYNLYVINPELCREWDYEKNESKPEEYLPNSAKKVWWKCNKNHSWKAAIASRNGHSCPYCLGKIPSANYNLLIIHPLICLDWDYVNNKKRPEEYCPSSGKKVWWKCHKCNFNWKASINSRSSNGNGCPNCNKSKGENKIKQYLDLYNFHYIPQKKFDNLVGLGNGNLSYDFYLPDYNLLIEYQGEFHDGSSGEYSKVNLKTQQEHDKRKREYAQKHNIKLLEIWYWESNNIEEILKKELNLY